MNGQRRKAQLSSPGAHIPGVPLRHPEHGQVLSVAGGGFGFEVVSQSFGS